MSNSWSIIESDDVYEFSVDSPESYFIINLSKSSTVIQEDQYDGVMLTDNNVNISIYTYNNRQGISVQGSDDSNLTMNMFINLSDEVVDDFKNYLDIGVVKDHRFVVGQNLNVHNGDLINGGPINVQNGDPINVQNDGPIRNGDPQQGGKRKSRKYSSRTSRTRRTRRIRRTRRTRRV